MKHIERDVPYDAFYFNPGNTKRYELESFVSASRRARPFDEHVRPLLVADRFEGVGSPTWKDYGTPSQHAGGRLVGAKGTLTILEAVNETNLMASVEILSAAEAGIVLRFHDRDKYLVALYSPSLKAIYLHDRKNGVFGDVLGKVAVPEIGPKISLTAAAPGDSAAMVLTDGTRAYHTPIVKVSNPTRGKTDLWFYQVGERQEFDNFELSSAQSKPMHVEQPKVLPDPTNEYHPPSLPSPQDWVLVLERVKVEPAPTNP